MQNPIDKGLERNKSDYKSKKKVAYFCLFYIDIKMMKVENILYFWLFPICKNKFSKIFFRYQIRKNNFHKTCLFETLQPQKLIPH